MKPRLPISRRTLHALSRDPRTLTRAVLLTLGFFILTAIGFGWKGSPEDDAQRWKALVEQYGGHGGSSLAELLQQDPVDGTALVRALRLEAAKGRAEDDPEAADENEALFDEATLVDGNPLENPQVLLTQSKLPETERVLFLRYYGTLRAKEANIPAAVAALSTGTVKGSPALPLTMAGDVLRRAQDFAGSLKMYEQAATFPEGEEARRRALELALVREWPEVLNRLLAVDGYRAALDSVDDELPIRVAQSTRDVGALVAISAREILEGFGHTGLLLLSLLSAAVWFVSLHKACRIPFSEWWISGVGLLLGVGSIGITLLFLLLQESNGGLSENGTADNDFIFYLAGVGLREETAKLIFFLPLLPLLRKRSPALALVAASCVGLGFALEENLSYYIRGGASASLVRFVSANFMHLSMTGLIGYSLFRFWRYPKNYGPAFAATFVAMVALHGFYDFCLTGHAGELGQFPIFILAGLAWFYFQTVRTEQDGAPQLLSAHAAFLLGSAVLTGCLLNYLVAQFGWHLAFSLMVPAFLSIVLTSALFVRFLRDV